MAKLALLIFRTRRRVSVAQQRVRATVSYFQDSMAFRMSDPEGCSTTSNRIPLGSITLDRREPVPPPERTSAMVAPALRSCVTVALASSVKTPMCVRPAGRFAVAGAISRKVSRLIGKNVVVGLPSGLGTAYATGKDITLV